MYTKYPETQISRIMTWTNLPVGSDAFSVGSRESTESSLVAPPPPYIPSSHHTVSSRHFFLSIEIICVCVLILERSLREPKDLVKSLLLCTALGHRCAFSGSEHSGEAWSEGRPDFVCVSGQEEV